VRLCDLALGTAELLQRDACHGGQNGNWVSVALSEQRHMDIVPGRPRKVDPVAKLARNQISTRLSEPAHI